MNYFEAAAQARIAGKRVEYKQLYKALTDIYSLHQTDYPAAKHPQAEFVEPDVDEIRKRYRDRAEAKSEVTYADRRSAFRQSLDDANTEIQRLRKHRLEKQQVRQAKLDEWWDAVTKLDEEAVLEALNNAFSDNYAIAAAIGIVGDEASVVVVIPPESEVPNRMPVKTRFGKLTSKRMSKHSKTFFQLSLITGSMLATVREAFAVIPGIKSVRVIAIRASVSSKQPEVIAAAHFERMKLDGMDWKAMNSIDAFNQISGDRILTQDPRTNKVVPLNLDEESDIRKVLESIDITELSSRKH